MQVGPGTCLSARLAIYRDGEPEPKVEEIQGTGPQEVIHRLCTAVEVVIREQRPRIPHAAVKAVIQNLVHAGFQDATISVMDSGRTVRVADRGPGISDKQLALQPGYSSAGEAERRIIPGVGSGLAVAARLTADFGGRLEIGDNLGGGTVVTMSLPTAASASATRQPDPASAQLVVATPGPWRAGGVSDKGKRLLLLLAELGGASLVTIGDELRLSAEAARVEVEALRRLGLLDPRNQRQITLTPAGLQRLDGIFAE